MRRIADFEDSPLVPALLVKLHEDGDPTLMNVTRNIIGHFALYYSEDFLV